MLVNDATLEGVSCLIFDEFHERSINSDLALALAARFEHQNLTLTFKMIMDETFQCLITHAPQNGEWEEGRFTGSRRSCNNKVSRLHQCFIDRVGYLVSWQMTSLLFYSI
jgi:hypothetical protein